MRRRLLRVLFAYRWPLYWLFMFLGTLGAGVGVDALFRKPVIWGQVLISAAVNATLFWGLARFARRWERRNKSPE
jgi:hypothetical protein